MSIARRVAQNVPFNDFITGFTPSSSRVGLMEVTASSVSPSVDTSRSHYISKTRPSCAAIRPSAQFFIVRRTGRLICSSRRTCRLRAL